MLDEIKKIDDTLPSNFTSLSWRTRGEMMPDEVYEKIYQYKNSHLFDENKVTNKQFGENVERILLDIIPGLSKHKKAGEGDFEYFGLSVELKSTRCYYDTKRTNLEKYCYAAPANQFSKTKNNTINQLRLNERCYIYIVAFVFRDTIKLVIRNKNTMAAICNIGSSQHQKKEFVIGKPHTQTGSFGKKCKQNLEAEMIDISEVYKIKQTLETISILK